MIPRAPSNEKFLKDFDSSSSKFFGVLLNLVNVLTKSLYEANKLSSQSENIRDALNYFTKNLKEEISPQNKKYIEEIFDLINCSNCGKTIISYQLRCGHNYCEECAEIFFLSKKDFSNLHCEKCSENVFPSDLGESFDSAWKDYKKMNSEACQNCETELIKNENDENCGHYCTECLLELHRSGQGHCKKLGCNKKFVISEDLINSQIKCAGCKNHVYLYGDRVRTVCDNHSLCYNCLKESLQVEKCNGCLKELSEADKRNSFNVIYKKCKVCEQSRESIYFVPKVCCEQFVCGTCQAPDTECKNCNEELLPLALDFVDRFSEIKRKLRL